MLARRLLFVPVVCVLTAGCASDPSVGPRQETGAAAGALGGALLGSALAGGGTGSRIAGAVLGAAAGGILGGAIGSSLDEQDRQRAYAAEMQALEHGQQGAHVQWRSQRTAYHGSVVPGPYYETRGHRCREYTHTVYINGQPQVARGTACRNPDGTWSAVG